MVVPLGVLGSLFSVSAPIVSKHFFKDEKGKFSNFLDKIRNPEIRNLKLISSLLNLW